MSETLLIKYGEPVHHHSDPGFTASGNMRSHIRHDQLGSKKKASLTFYIPHFYFKKFLKIQIMENIRVYMVL